jgi:hypothetical protein
MRYALAWLFDSKCSQEKVEDRFILAKRLRGRWTVEARDSHARDRVREVPFAIR